MSGLTALIRNCNFTKHDIRLATHGECAYFALGLQELLESREIPSQLMVATFGENWSSWAHALVLQQQRYYDIRGHVLIKDIHAEFRTTIMKKCTKENLLSYSGMNPFNSDRIEYWHQRLQKG